ncbi:MAG: hypothetical protein ACRDSH_19785 [Pseudonocardiaceae bacterium]
MTSAEQAATSKVNATSLALRTTYAVQLRNTATRPTNLYQNAPQLEAGISRWINE